MHWKRRETWRGRSRRTRQRSPPTRRTCARSGRRRSCTCGRGIRRAPPSCWPRSGVRLAGRATRELYATQRLADLYLGALGDDGRAMVELRRLVERFPGTREGDGARWPCSGSSARAKPTAAPDGRGTARSDRGAFRALATAASTPRASTRAPSAGDLAYVFHAVRDTHPARLAPLQESPVMLRPAISRRRLARRERRRSSTVAPLAAQATPSRFAELTWRNIGPFRGGRTKAATGVPQQPNLFYIAAVNGGAWKTTDYGRTWTPIFDGQPSGSIGALAVAPSDPNVIYIGSGEGLQRPDLSTGDGIYKSVDAGKTWTHLGLRDGQQIPQIAIDPRNPEPPLRRGARSSLRPQRRARAVPLARRWAELHQGPGEGREHRGDRRGDGAERSQHALCGAVGGAAGAVGERRLAGAGDGAVQVDRRWRQLDADHERAPDAGRRVGAHRDCGVAEPSAAAVHHHRRRGAERDLPIG